MNYFWTENEVSFLKENWIEKGSAFVSEKLGRTKIAIASKAKKLGLRRYTYYTGNISHRNTQLKKRYNITIEEYDQIFQKQNGVCAICRKEEVIENQYGIKRLCVDHSHKTGKVRGLLCHNCNAMLGHAKDNYVILINAVYYLVGMRQQQKRTTGSSEGVV